MNSFANSCKDENEKNVRHRRARASARENARADTTVMALDVIRGVSRAVTRANAVTTAMGASGWASRASTSAGTSFARARAMEVRTTRGSTMFASRASSSSSVSSSSSSAIARARLEAWSASARSASGRAAAAATESLSRANVARRRAYRPPPPGYGGGFGSQYGVPNEGERAVWVLIGLNGAVYYAWATTDDSRFMRKHFMVSEESLARGRYHTMLTSAFSHFDLTHLGMNMIALYFFGRSLCERFGGRYLLTLYCVGGVGASAAHVLWCKRQRQRRMRMYEQRRGQGNIFERFDAYVSRFIEDSSARRGFYLTPAALGASGAVNAIVAFETLLYPFRTIYLYAIVPVPSILLGGLFLMRDIVGIQNGGSGVAHAGHLGGAAVGALALATVGRGGARFSGFRRF